jgi:dipeptidyl aminopeptidase/acylaminoacyl peptidase
MVGRIQPGNRAQHPIPGPWSRFFPGSWPPNSRFARLRKTSACKKAVPTLLCLLVASVVIAATEPTPLLHNPALNRTQIVFSDAGDLWTVSREGGTATRLTAGTGIETLPVFSPDGESLAFTSEYDGNIDVYTMPAVGGVPKRITYHAAPDYAAGWSPDGRRILFRSNRQGVAPCYTQLFSGSREGGLPEALPFPMAFTGSYSPDGRKLAYAPQVDKQGLVLDERFNGGGQVADYVINVLNRPLMSFNKFRYGAIERSPAGSILGRK